MKINPSDFRVPPGKTLNLKKWPTLIKPVYKSKKKSGLRKLRTHVVPQIQPLREIVHRYGVGIFGIDAALAGSLREQPMVELPLTGIFRLYGLCIRMEGVDQNIVLGGYDDGGYD